MKKYTRLFHSMGCACSIHFYAHDELEAENVYKAVFAEVDRLDRYYTNYSSTSFTAEINKSAGDKSGILVDSETAILLDYAQQCTSMSDGLFDITAGALRYAWDFESNNPTLPSKDKLKKLLKTVGWDKVEWKKPKFILPKKGMMIDFGGVVKEYAADAAAKICHSMGIHHGVIDMSGDIKIIGPHIDGRPWLIGVRHPREEGKEMAFIELGEGALATSGDYEKSIKIAGKNYSHILNPKTGWPVEGISSVTAVAEFCLVAGSLTTISCLKGPREGVEWLNSLGFPYFCADEGGNSIGSKCFKISQSSKFCFPQGAACL
ncbi:MAG: FAD:protein FMN transferase [Alphaproteobacteria bacterium]|nr:FAD:protein FMN transferase [Alphaproteobacteria bacterium]